MKKILLATVIVAASISASAQVTIFGSVREFIDNTTLGTVATTKMKDDASSIGFKSTEKLGSDVTANMVIETGFSASDPKVGPANQIGDRQSTVGLASKDGTLDLGRKWHTQGLALKASDPFNTLYGSVAVDIHNFHNRRSGDAVFASYKVGPVTVAYDRTITINAAEAIGYSVSGKLGPVTTTVAHFEQGGDKSNVISGQAVFNSTKVLGSYSIDDGLTTKTKGALVSVVQGIDGMPLSIRGGYGIKTGLVTGDVTAYNMAADYLLSKRTVTSLIYRHVSDVTETKQLGLGLTHSF